MVLSRGGHERARGLPWRRNQTFTCGRLRNDGGMTVLEVETAEEFRRTVLAAKEPTVVMFWASWCPFCRAFKPTFDEYAGQYGGRFALVRLDDYDNPLWDEYAVNVVPSLALFRDGALAARKDGRLGRGLSAAELDAFLRQALPPAHAERFA